MKEIVFATTNSAKIEEIERVLKEFGYSVSHARLEIDEPYGLGLAEIAKLKAINAFENTGKPSAALDTGFFINSLDGYPGDHVGDAIKRGLDWIISSVDGKDRKCSYKNCLAYMDGQLEEPVVFESELMGTISDSPRGTIKPLWCPIHRIFVPIGSDKTLAEIAETDDSFLAWRKERFPYSTSYKLIEWLSKN